MKLLEPIDYMEELIELNVRYPKAGYLLHMVKRKAVDYYPEYYIIQPISKFIGDVILSDAEIDAWNNKAIEMFIKFHNMKAFI